MKKLLFILLMPLLFFSQGENDNWYFGDHAAVNFSNQSNPVALNNSQMFAYEACGSVSDPSGNLLFYTNGVTVWNREHQVMDNGTGLHGHDSSGQVQIVKSPSNPNQYFLFTVSDIAHTSYNDPTNIVKYSIIDMNEGGNGLNGLPLGAVMEGYKNITILDDNGDNFKTEGISIIPKPNDQSYWILLIKNNNLYSFSLNSTGFDNGNPIISIPSNSPNINNLILWLNSSNILNVSNAYTHYVSFSSDFMLSHYVYSYDAYTGMLTNDYMLTINAAPQAGKSEFSGNGSIYYLPNYHAIYAVELSSGNYVSGIPAGCQFENCDIFIQRNKYDEVYFAKGDSQYLGKINNPDVFGTNVSLDDQAIFLNNGISKYSLPDLVLDLVTVEEYCPNNLTLTSIETNNFYVHSASNSIKTHTNYVVSPPQSPNQNITLKAGNYIELLPNTEIRQGSVFLAKIEDCKNEMGKQKPFKFSKVINLPQNKISEISVYPNPAITEINILTNKENLLFWELSDISGKKILSGKNNRINIEGISQGIYMLLIKTNKETVTKKIIKK